MGATCRDYYTLTAHATFFLPYGGVGILGYLTRYLDTVCPIDFVAPFPDYSFFIFIIVGF